MYAKGKDAWGICDRTGFRYKLSDLVWEYRNGRRTGLRVGRDVVDEPHPQENPRLGQRREERVALRDPRPDMNQESLAGWNPVGNTGNIMMMTVGLPKVVIGTDVVVLALEDGSLFTLEDGSLLEIE